MCNYSTTTKGNLSIHMQSDKHLNNMQTLQNGGSIPSAEQQVFGQHPGGVGVVTVPSVTQASTHHPPHHHHPTQSSAHMTGPCGSPSPTKPKSKPTWRCEVCDYETNVARNLRIHMTSEKHMHNMMLLQQNVTQMQHGRLGLGAMPSPSEAELYQYYLTQNMSLPPGLKMDPAGAEAQFLLGGFHLDPNMAALAPQLGEFPQSASATVEQWEPFWLVPQYCLRSPQRRQTAVQYEFTRGGIALTAASCLFLNMKHSYKQYVTKWKIQL